VINITDIDRRDTIRYGKNEVSLAIDEFISGNTESLRIYWNRDEYKKLKDKDFERFGKIFSQLKNMGVDQEDIGKYIYHIGDVLKLPGFAPSPLRQKEYQ
jgi:hypothetical protein